MPLIVAAAAALILVLGVTVVLASRSSGPSDVATFSPDPIVEQPSTTVASTAPSVPAEPPRFATSVVCELERVPGPLFEGVVLPSPLTRIDSMRDCGVMGEPSFRESWFAGDPRDPATTHVLLVRTEQRAAGAAVGSGRSDEWTTVNGKPAEVLRVEDEASELPIIQISWEQDRNGVGQVVGHGFDLGTVRAIAESFDRAVADRGPRHALEPLSRELAVAKGKQVASTVTVLDPIVARRTTPTTLATAGGPSIDASIAAADAPIWVLSAPVAGSVPEPFGGPRVTWGVLVLDGLDGRLLATATGGEDGSVEPPWLDAIVDEDPGSG